MKRVVFILALTMMLLLPIGIHAAGFGDLPIITEARIGNVRIEPRILDGERIGGIVINGVVPEITGSEMISDAVYEIFNTRTNGGIGTVEFSYNIVSWSRFVSIIFMTESATHGGARTSRVDAISFDRFTLEPIQAQSAELLGENGFDIATDIVNDFISQNFRNMPRIQALNESSNFYVAGGAVHFLFDRYEIAPGSEGIQSVPVYLNNLHRYFLEEDDIYIDRLNHGVRMLPLRRVTRAFEYDVLWNASTLEMGVVRINGNGARDIVATLTLDQNVYMRAQDTIPRTLEAAPQIINGVAHVPISFFEVILGIHYNISTDGTIELTTYRSY